MVSKITKWGNSLGLRIPKSFAVQAGIDEGSRVDIRLEDDQIIVRPVRPEQYCLKDMMSKIEENNLHDEVPIGEPAGR
jgi:antitoxin MazE